MALGQQARKQAGGHRPHPDKRTHTHRRSHNDKLLFIAEPTFLSIRTHHPFPLLLLLLVFVSSAGPSLPSRQLPTVRDDDRAGDGPRALPLCLHGLDDALAIHHLAEDAVLAVQPRGGSGGDEELGAVCVGAGIRHGEEEGSVVGELEVLVREFLPVDRLSSGAVAGREISSLAHELRDDSVEAAALVVQGLPEPSDASLSRAEGAEVFGRLGYDVREELELDPPLRRTADGDVEEDTWVSHSARG